MSIRRLTIVVLVATALLLATGCADFKTYLKDRGNDLADCFTVRAGMSYGLGVRAQVTNYVTASVGLSKERKIGYFGRAYVEAEGVWAGPPIFPLYVLYQFLDDIHNEDMLYVACVLCVPFCLFTDARRYEGRILPGAFTFLCVNAAEFGADTEQMYSRIEPPTPFLREKFFVEVGATLGVVGFDIGFNPVEFVDFLLGWTTLDITGDDTENFSRAACGTE